MLQSPQSIHVFIVVHLNGNIMYKYEFNFPVCNQIKVPYISVTVINFTKMEILTQYMSVVYYLSYRTCTKQIV